MLLNNLVVEESLQIKPTLIPSSTGVSTFATYLSKATLYMGYDTTTPAIEYDTKTNIIIFGNQNHDNTWVNGNNITIKSIDNVSIRGNKIKILSGIHLGNGTQDSSFIQFHGYGKNGDDLYSAIIKTPEQGNGMIFEGAIGGFCEDTGNNAISNYGTKLPELGNYIGRIFFLLKE